MGLQEQIDSFQRMVFAHFKLSTNNECRISALVPLVKESWGIYRFITSMLRAMHRSTLGPAFASYTLLTHFIEAHDHGALEPLRDRYSTQHYNLRKFYYECSNLKYLTGLINVPKLAHVSFFPSFPSSLPIFIFQDPPNLLDSGTAPDMPPRPTTTVNPPPPVTPTPDQSTINEQARMLREYENQQSALRAAQEAEARNRQELEEQQQREFQQRQLEQEARERAAQEQLQQQQLMQYSNQAAEQQHGLEREILALRGQFDRDQLMLEQYDRVRVSSEKIHRIHLRSLESESARTRNEQCRHERFITAFLQR